MAVVLDEYGGMTGIVTINDLVEQLVGDLGEEDVCQNALPLIEAVDSGTWEDPWRGAPGGGGPGTWCHAALRGLRYL